MAVYIVHQRTGLMDGDLAAGHGTQFVREGFYWSAFLFPVIWFVVHRLWLALLVFLVFVVGLQALALMVGGTAASLAIYFLVSLLVGLEASSLRCWTLARTGWVFAGIVTGGSRDEGERRFFASQSAPVETTQDRPQAHRDMAWVRRPRQPESEPVLGVFPAPEAS